jgi:hypothetical protein
MRTCCHRWGCTGGVLRDKDEKVGVEELKPARNTYLHACIHTYIRTYIYTHIHTYVIAQVGYCVTGNEEGTVGKLEPLYKGTECTCPIGLVEKLAFTKASGQLGKTSTNAAVSYNVRVGGSFYEMIITAPIGEAEGELKCDVESPVRRAKGSLAGDLSYITREAAKEWTAIVSVTPTTLTLKVDPFQRLYTTSASALVIGGGSGRGGAPGVQIPVSSRPSSGLAPPNSLSRSGNSYISGATLSTVVAGAIGTAVGNGMVTSAASSGSGAAGGAGMSSAFQLLGHAQFLAAMENLGGPATATPGAGRRASAATNTNVTAVKVNSTAQVNVTAARGAAGNGTIPEGQPGSTKELSQNMKWSNLHVLTLDAYDYFDCVQDRIVSADLFGTFVMSGEVPVYVRICPPPPPSPVPTITCAYL